jgi:hypothetical protein
MRAVDVPNGRFFRFNAGQYGNFSKNLFLRVERGVVNLTEDWLLTNEDIHKSKGWLTVELLPEDFSVTLGGR